MRSSSSRRAIALIAISRWLRAASGVPDGISRIGIRAQRRRSSDPKHGLAGKPDYLVRQDGGIVPVEVKTGPERRVYRSDILQLAAYCLLTEENYADFGGYGILRAGKVSRRANSRPNCGRSSWTPWKRCAPW